MKYKKKKNRKNQYRKMQRMRKLMIAFGLLLCAVAFMAGGFSVLGISGKYNLKKQTVSYVAERGKAVQAMSGKKAASQERWDRYEGRSYSYNEDILTFLFMAIDHDERADMLFLIVLNSHEESVKLIPINCNTMTVIDIYDGQGAYENAITAQIGIQYGFGKDRKESCEYQVKAVRNLFYGIPISGYLAVDIDDIPKVMELMDEIDLENIRDQDGSVELSADSRLERQSWFFAELISQGNLLVKKDFTIPIRIFNEISGSVVTDITADEVAYLAATAGGYHFDSKQIMMIPGTNIGDKFYVDEDGLYELIAGIFYEPVD